VSGDLLGLADAALALAGSSGVRAVEVGLTRSTAAVTRFADSRIHQNTMRADGEARVRVVVDDARVGVVATNQLDAAAVRRAAEAAREIARVTPPDPQFAGLAPGGATYGEAGSDDGQTAAASPHLRAQLVAAMLAELPRGVLGAGTMETGRVERAVATSLGVRAAHAGTSASARILASGADSTGYAEDCAPTLGRVHPAALAARAARKVELGASPRDVAPGPWQVVLSPAATETLVAWLGYVGFAGKAVHEGRSPLSGRLGEQVCSPLVTIVDDALSPRLPGVPFDAEGTPKRRLPLIENGVAVGVAHDRATAALAGAQSTGSALPAPNPYGGLPTHLVMEPGSTSTEDLIAGCERGLYVTRFHYTNLVHPVQSTITGMTRDGTFLIENGSLSSGVRNLRFTQSILAALSTVEQLGSEVGVSSDLFFGAGCTPALRLGEFTFTSTTAH